MGSLMAGWDSPVRDPKSINFNRNMSMTKEEIASYWKSKKNEEEAYGALKSCQTFSNGDKQLINIVFSQKIELEKVYTRSNSLPSTKEIPVIEENHEKLFNSHGWWINSRWAFLNEPPVIGETHNRYASQFHVAQKHLNGSDHQHHVAGDAIIRT
ncbi:hypothetical protein LXL04_030481 [Taraxacum kok-saghyz]